MKILAFTGMPFSGKSEAVSLARNRGYFVSRMGDLVWEETKRQGLVLTDENVGRIASEMRKTKGKDIWAKRTVEKIKGYNASKILIIDGIRNIEEVRYFKNNLSTDFILVTVHADESLRYQRAIARRRVDDSMAIDKIKERDRREIGWGLDKVINAADITITNNGALADFIEKIDSFFNGIEKR